MNDRYLFRGKRIDDGTWVIGKIVSNNLGVNIFCDDNPHECGRDGYIEIIEYYKVDPATVSQCSGLRDLNNKLIFEGDILDIPECGRIPVIFKAGCFGGEQWYMGFAPFLDSIWGCGGEIIGNKWDTPELLEAV